MDLKVEIGAGEEAPMGARVGEEVPKDARTGEGMRCNPVAEGLEDDDGD